MNHEGQVPEACDKMPEEHINFWMDLAGRVGTPIFAATLVAALLSKQIEITHVVLMVVGLVMIYLHHRFLYH